MSLTELGKLAHLEHVLVELVVVADGEDNLVEALQLLDVVGRHVPQLDPATGTTAKRSKGLTKSPTSAQSISVLCFFFGFLGREMTSPTDRNKRPQEKNMKLSLRHYKTMTSFAVL